MIGDDAYCELSFSPNVNLIATVRRFVGDFYVKVLKDSNITSRLVVATHELLENAVRYSVDGKSRIRISVSREGEGGNVRVRIDTHNRTDAAHHRELDALLEELPHSSDRAKVYQRLLARSAKRETGSGLGLGRIYAESELDLRCCMEGDTVRLTAEGVFTSAGDRA